MKSILAISLLQCINAFALPWSVIPELADHMVLQRGVPLICHGTSTPGEAIQLRFLQHDIRTTADALGQWKLTLPACSEQTTPSRLTWKHGAETQVIDDVLVGDVWFFSGQSNMDFPIALALGGSEALATANDPLIRILHLTGLPTDRRQYKDNEIQRLTADTFFQGSWQRADSKQVRPLSAIAWWTAQALREKNGVPIGIIENAVGGSGTEAWISNKTLHSRTCYAPLCDDWLQAPLMSPWARERARFQLGNHLERPHPFQPTFLYQATFHRLRDFPIKGVVWYQGETNAEIDNVTYNQQLLTDLIHDWRQVCGQELLPFYLIQLPRIGGHDPLRAHWPLYRQAQQQCAQSLKQVHLIPTTDLGYDSPNVHPPDKKPIALRLAETIGKQP